MLQNLFIFPDAVRRFHPEEKIKLNIHGSVLEFFRDGARLIVDMSLLQDGTSTIILHNPITDCVYVLYNYREILQALDLTPRSFGRTMHQRCFMQIDKSGGKVFIKVFLLQGDYTLDSDTDDFSSCSHKTLGEMHELDWEYSWVLRDTTIRFDGDKVRLKFFVKKSDFWQEHIYINHAGQSQEIFPGWNEVEFKYIETEDAYVGAKNCRYKGRAIKLREGE